MSIPRRAPTPVHSGPSSGAVDTMAVSQQSHIDQLVAQNRTLQQTIKKLKDDLSSEQERAKQAVLQIQQKWKEERREWQEGCDTLQACHKLEYLRILAELEKERLNVLKEQDVTRQEMFARLQRDHRITMFQIRESELADKVEELELELLDVKACMQSQEKEREGVESEAVRLARKECAEYAAKLVAAQKDLTAAQEEQERLEDELIKQRQVSASLLVASESTTSKLERATLQLEGAQSTNADLQQKNDDLKRNNAELKRQVDKWQKLDTKGEAEVDTLRKRRIELEVREKELENRLVQAGKKQEELAKALEKEKKKMEKTKEAAREWKEAAEANAQETVGFQKQITRLEKQVKKLKADLEREGARVYRSNNKGKEPAVTEDVASGEDLPAVAEARTKPPSKSTRSRPTARAQLPSRRKRTPLPLETDPGPSKRNVSRKEATKCQSDTSDTEELREVDRMTSVAPSVSDSRVTEGDNIEDVQEPEVGQHKVGDGAHETSNSDDGKRKRKREAAAMDEPLHAPKRTRSKPKAVTQDGYVREAAAPPKGKTKSRARAGSVRAEDNGKAKSSQIQASSQDVVEAEKPEASENRPAKKKMRKINIFPSAEPSSFNFVTQGMSTGLNIPTNLSPVKETDIFPSRSGSVVDSMRKMLLNSITKRK